MKKTILIAGLLFVGTLLIANGEYLPISDLSIKSDAVVRGSITGITPVEEGDWSDYYFTMKVDEVVVGKIPDAKEILIVRASEASGAWRPDFRRGEEIILFLANKDGRIYGILGNELGLIRIFEERRSGLKTAVRDLRHLLPPTNGAVDMIAEREDPKEFEVFTLDTIRTLIKVARDEYEF